jgi:2-phospho-L-lactate guanylyltransferase
MIHALVPVKNLAAGKSRLLPELDDAQRQAMALAMLRDVLEALLAAQRVSRVAVVTPDETVARAAREAGAEAILHLVPGLNGSLEAGAAALAPKPDDGLLIVLGDVAGALPEELDVLCCALDSCSGPAIALAPATDGGTAALLRTPADAIAPHFGADSAKRHREAADQAGVAYAEIPLPSLSIDLDIAADIEPFLASDNRGHHTRALLADLHWSHKP